MERRSLHGFGSAVQKAAGDTVLSLLVKHETLSTFLSPVALQLPRWQSFMALVTMIMSVLVVDVWFYYSKSLNCCREVRLLLGCDPDYLLPCREFVGNCGDTKDQFVSLQYSGIPDDYECHQFPDETSIRDKIVVGLICTAVAVPFTNIIGEVFAKSNEPEFPDLQLSWPLKVWTRLLFLRWKDPWDWRRSRPGALRAMAARWAHDTPGKALYELFMQRVGEPLYDMICCEAGEGEGEGEGEERRRGAKAEAEAEAGSRKGSGKLGGGTEAGKQAQRSPGGGADREPVPPAGGDPEHGERSADEGADEEAGGDEARSSSDLRSQSSHARVAHPALQAVEEMARADAKRHRLRMMAVLFVYTAWAIMVWIIFVYGASPAAFPALRHAPSCLAPPLPAPHPLTPLAGKLIYSLYGQKTEAAFIKNWGVGLGIEQAALPHRPRGTAPPPPMPPRSAQPH